MGHVYIGEQMIPPHQIETYLREELGKRQDKYIRLRGDRIASLGSTIELLDTARKAGAEGIEIVTEENESPAR
jgi:biopolymer transport protein ExbD